jgi:hypothetical protein
MQAIESEKAAKEAEVQRRSEEEKARLARVGLDAEHFCNVGVVGTTGKQATLVRISSYNGKSVIRGRLLLQVRAKPLLSTACAV